MLSETVQLALIAAAIPSSIAIISNIVTHVLAARERKAAKDETGKKLDEVKKETDEKLNHITELSNSMLSQTKAEKYEAEKKLEQARDAELAAARAKNIEYEKQIALMTNPKKD